MRFEALDNLLVVLPRAPTRRPLVSYRQRGGTSPRTTKVHARRHRSSWRRRFLLVVLSVVVVSVAGVADATSGAVRNQLLLSFTRRPDNFSELYFPSPSTVPSSFVPGRPLAVEFGLANDSDTTRSYTYVVTAGSRNGHGSVVGTGTLRLKANQRVATPLRVSLPAGTTSLAVSLAGQPVVIRLLLRQGVSHAS